MDSRLVNEKAETYRDRTLRLTPAIFERLALVKKSIHLRVEEFYLSCVPFDISLTKASLLAFLSEREVKFFEPFAAKPQKLSLSWKPPYGSKTETFFLMTRLKAFRKPDPASPYCFIDVEFSSSPLAYKELLVGCFVDMDEAEHFYSEAGEVELSAEQIEKALGRRHLSPIADGSPTDTRFKVLALSPKTLKVFGEIEGEPPKEGDAMEFEPTDGDFSCLLRGQCAAAAPCAEAPGFYALTVSLQFSTTAHSRMRNAVGWNAKSQKPKPA